MGEYMKENTELLTVDTIRKRVYVIRGKQVMLDQDLAVIYGYELKGMNQQVIDKLLLASDKAI